MISQTTTEPVRRQRRKLLTDLKVAALPRKRKRYIEGDPQQPGLYLRVPPKGPVVFIATARYAGKQIWATLGGNDDLKIEDARAKARDAIKRIKRGELAIPAPPPPPPEPIKPDTVADVADQWLKRHVQKKGLITGSEIGRQIAVYITPLIGSRAFVDIKRSDIAKLLDAVEDKHGPWIADSVLGVLRSMATWFAMRNDNYRLPFVRGMRRVPPQDRKRSRILTDVELRKVWVTADNLTAAERKAMADPKLDPVSAHFGRFIQLSLLLAQRREKLATMKWSDIVDGVWNIPIAPREKGTAGSLKLPKLALDIIARQPRFVSNPYVFSGRGAGHIRGFTVLKQVFDKKSDVTGYSLHDLRRTARSLMSRAGVQSEHAERVLGHKLTGVEGVYDVHAYTKEKADALVKLAHLIETIVYPPDKKVVPLHEARS